MNRVMALSITIEDKRQRIFLLMEAIGLAGLLLPHAQITARSKMTEPGRFSAGFPLMAMLSAR